MTDRVVIVGAGQAGAQTAISLRQLGFDGRITLLGDEPFPPYQRPPLSKKLMTGEMDVERTYIRSEAYYAKSGVDLVLGARVAAIDRERRAVLCEGGTALN
jgi:3-phenylpropionate/trans-cinnamate dioxygenase ferredoxin reductase subunit